MIGQFCFVAIDKVEQQQQAQFMTVGLVAIYSFINHKWLTFRRGIRFQLSRLAPHRAAVRT
jgi:hypothetical protein